MEIRKLIIGLGTGRCGTMSLSKLLSMQENTIVSHETGTPLPWDFDLASLQKKSFLI